MWEKALWEEEYNGFRAVVVHDEVAEDPRRWDNFGTLVIWHPRYDLGDPQAMMKFPDPGDFDAMALGAQAVVLPVYLLDHSGLWLNTTGFRHEDPGSWDSGQVGWIYMTAEDARREFGDDYRDHAVRALIHEVETYAAYIAGETFGWSVLDCFGEVVDGGWGFYGKAGFRAAQDIALETLAQLVKEWDPETAFRERVQVLREEFTRKVRDAREKCFGGEVRLDGHRKGNREVDRKCGRRDPA